MAEPLTARFSSRTVIGPQILELTFAMVSPSSLQFKAGQFVTMVIARHADGTPAKRSYSIAGFGHADSTRLRFIVRLVPEGPASAFFERLVEGTEVEMTGPYGFFVLDDHHPGDVIFAATGTGVAAVMPMLEELATRTDDEAGARRLLWGLRHPSDIFLADEIAALCAKANTQLHIHLSAPDESWPGPCGRITPVIFAQLAHLHEPTFYLVGNSAMIDEVKAGLIARGVNRKKQIRTEAFF